MVVRCRAGRSQRFIKAPVRQEMSVTRVEVVPASKAKGRRDDLLVSVGVDGLLHFYRPPYQGSHARW